MECPICYEQLGENLSVNIPCKIIPHKLCIKCFVELEKRECPLCRYSFEQHVPKFRKKTVENLLNLLPMLIINENS